MRVLLLHADHIEFEARKKAVKDAEALVEKGQRLDECVVCFFSVEAQDMKDPEYVLDELLKTIGEMASQVKSKRVALYPYAHLSSDLAPLKFAQKMLELAFSKVCGEYEAIKAPFGWYKSFSLRCKGHPMSELSRTISPKGQKETQGESKALSREDAMRSSWYIMDLDGKLHDIKGYDFKQQKNLKIFASYERSKDRGAEGAPPHIELMRRLELVDYEPASDPGNFRYYPKGRMIKALLEQYVTQKIMSYGGMEVETPLMYDLKHPTLEKYLNRFPARQYILESDEKRYFMRFAACFGQFLMAHDATLSYRSLPLRIYELARYAFRREKSGELTGLRRLRAFTMPDVHALCADLSQAMQEYKRRFSLCCETVEEIGISRQSLEMGIRVTKDFYDEHKEFLRYIVSEFGKPVLVEMWDERIFYFKLKYEFNFVDSQGKASALSTDQIDIENGLTYDIRFTTSDGGQDNPVILHCSPSGAIERIIYALLEKAHMDSKTGEAPSLPLWLSPTQARVIPVSENHLGDAVKVAKELSESGVRADVDDRSETLGKKIRNAEREWVPYILVIGEKEANTGMVSVRRRGSKNQQTQDACSLASEIMEYVSGMPKRPLPLPMMLSQRPVFVG